MLQRLAVVADGQPARDLNAGGELKRRLSGTVVGAAAGRRPGARVVIGTSFRLKRGFRPPAWVGEAGGRARPVTVTRGSRLADRGVAGVRSAGVR